MAARKFILTTALAILGFAAAPTTASADWLFTPFVGTAFNSKANFNDGIEDADEFERQFTYGASIGWMGAGIVGFEFDFGYSPNFFETLSGGDGIDFVNDSNVTTLMGNVIVGAPIGGQSGPGIRPFAVGGVGLLRTHVGAVEDFFPDDVDGNDFGFNIGAGVNGFFTDAIGIRGDVRYFRSFESNDESLDDLKLGKFDFWRATVGVTFRWGSD